MRSRRIRHLAALVVSLALAGSVPGAAIADQGGVPNPNSKQCPSKGKGTTKSPPNDKGKKCGFHKNSG
jgi:hypothetical protein